MPTITTHAPGTFCWFELATTDDAGAQRFYTSLFGWTEQGNPMGDAGTYHLFKRNGLDAAAMYKMMPDMMKQGVPPHWMAYIATDDVDRTVEKAKGLGGAVVAGPMDVMEHGRFAVIRDPQGAAFALWQPAKNTGVGVVGEPGSFCWAELMTRDTSGSQNFYTRLFGWSAAPFSAPGAPPGMSYTVFKNRGAERGQAGMMAMTPDMGAVPPHWMIYFAVTDCDAAAKKVQDMGGRTIVPPRDIPTVGRFALLTDPQGAAFSILQPQM